jgi:uncharacterized repeat protein (TIGR01451 family)
LVNKAEVHSDTPDNNPHNNTASLETNINYGAADLGVKKDSNRDKVVGGDRLEYTLRVSNNGPADACNVVITDTLPPSVTLLSAPGSSESDPLTWYTDALTAGTVWTLTVAVRVNVGASGILVNTACVTSTVSEDNTENNCDNEQTGVSVLVTNRALACEKGLWCQETVFINSPYTVYLPVLLKTQ